MQTEHTQDTGAPPRADHRHPASSLTLQTTAFRVANMDCRNEEAAIRVRLAQLPEVEALSFDLPARRLVVKHRLPDPRPLLHALTEIGMSASLEAEGTVADGDACGFACSPTCGGSVSVPSTHVFTVPDMDCRNEEAAIRARLEPLDGVNSLEFDLRALQMSHP